MKWIFGILFLAGHVLAAATTTTTAAAKPSADPCNQCKASDQKDRVEDLMLGPYEDKFVALHSAIEAKDFSNLTALTNDWNDSIAQILDLIEKDGCLYYTTFSALRTLIITIFNMVGTGDQMEDYNLPEEAWPVITACGNSAEKVIQVMRVAHLAQPTCYPCKYIDTTAQYVTTFNCYVKRMGMPPIAPLDFCKAEQDLCPLLVSVISDVASTTVVPSSAAVSSAAAVSSLIVSSQAAASSQAAVSSQAAASSQAAVSSQAAASSQAAVSSQGANSQPVGTSSQAIVSSQIAVSSQAASSEAAVSSQAASSKAAVSSQAVMPSHAVSSQAAGSQATGSSQAAGSQTAVNSNAQNSALPSVSITSAQGSVFSTSSDIPASDSSSLGAPKSTSSKQASETNDGSVVTTVVTEFTTYCPEPTTFCVGDGKCYTATGATTITVTDCPCTLTTTCAPEEQPTAVDSNRAVPTMPLLTVGPETTAPVVAPESQVPPVAPVASMSQVPSVAPANVGSTALPQSLVVILGAILLISV